MFWNIFLVCSKANLYYSRYVLHCVIIVLMKLRIKKSPNGFGKLKIMLYPVYIASVCHFAFKLLKITLTCILVFLHNVNSGLFLTTNPKFKLCPVCSVVLYRFAIKTENYFDATFLL